VTAHGVDVVAASLGPLAVPAPVEAEADAIAAELRTLSRDAALTAALQALRGHFRREN
jgi:hypothetical protein